MLSDIEFLRGLNAQKPIDPPEALISEYINSRRVMPAGSPMPGPMDVGYTPYFIEVMDAMGPYSGVSTVSVCKGVQIGATANCAENVIAYYMDANPQEILYASATDGLLEKWTKRLEPLIDSCGFRHKISAQVENTKTRKSGDKTYSKEYAGGSLSMSSLQSPAALRSESKRVVIVDEIDGAPAKLTTGEGSPLFVLQGRAAAFGARSKFMEFSTPSTFEASVIWKRFEQGDQRKYFVPCPHCGEYQVLIFEQLRPEYQADTLDRAWYECEKCAGRIENYHKTELLARGKWRATAQPRTKNHRSYHISTLYSPVGMMNWTQVYQKHLDSIDDPAQRPTFQNLYLGLPYKEEGSRPDIKRVIALRGNYLSGEVPEGVLYLTAAADVQRGAEKYQNMTGDELAAEIARIEKSGRDPWKSKLPRIELEVYGTGKNYQSWSIDYLVFYGHTTSGGYVGAFEKMYEWGLKGMTYRRRDGVEFNIMTVLVDATDGVTQPAVYDFCERFGPATYPTINASSLKLKQDPTLDPETQRTRDRYRLTKGAHGGGRVTISTVHYKKALYQRLNIRRNLTVRQPPGFCEFPRNRPDHYFAMLTAEEMRIDGTFYNGGRPNEALDCRVYAMCAADVWIEAEVTSAKNRAKKQGYPEREVLKIDKNYILAHLEKAISDRITSTH